ncbi:Rpn family recombination-promoting nuclease/putative transposase [Rickettsia bellii]|uniref:Transposase and inactivated derivative n=4 Tax=Rickettsia bellii TaxID=33990 RepID=Q1RKI3_RICBR|nr:Rpn family recombination-promoting nuclease/putative transposase [Rickettsia bellii]ABE04131.1 Transposase and inactivated derivative [Rickettsia bellii RML369-C]
MSDKTNLSHNVVNKEEFAGDPKPHPAAYTLVREDKGLGSTPKLPLETSYVKGLLKHDKFFQKALSNPIVAREFFEEYLPTEIKALFSPTTLTLENDSFIDPNLKESITDVLYSARINNRDCYIYILCEHQSSSDPHMAFRLFKYMLNIAEKHLISHPDSKKFPFIYPLVYSNDHKKYTAPLNLWDLFENSELVKDTWSNNYQLISLRDISDDKLKENPWLAPLQILMKYIHKPNVFDKWQEISGCLATIAASSSGIEYIKSALSYSLTKI